MFGSIELDYKAALNAPGALIFVALFAVTLRRGIIDPMCGMTVDRDKALTATSRGETFYFCSSHCRDQFEAPPAELVGGP
jgi:YHS domain-containing protein